jgi:hypothetical protein
MATVTAERDGNGALQQKRWKQGGYKTLPFIMGEYSVSVEFASSNIMRLPDSERFGCCTDC